jgi:peptidoglycan/LPS O-acetylase OafA/YrhL
VWVAIGHGLQLSGVLVPTNFVLKFLLSGGDAVAVFMIVSGFVITNLLIVKQEPYPQYIVRRFFRLYPAYVICCIAGYLLVDDWANVVQRVPWLDAPGWDRYTRSILELEAQTRANFWPHFALHAAMLHGAVPVEVLKSAAMTFLPAAWSISLEWQFYIIAPLILASFGKSWQMLAVVTGAVVALLCYKFGLLGHYTERSSLAGATPFFAIGIASRLLYEFLGKLRVSALLASAICVFGCIALIREPLPIMIWTIFYSHLVWGRATTFTGKLFRLLTTAKPVLLLGEASYSLYLVHRPVQVALASLSLGLFAATQMTMLAVQMIAIAIAIPVSLLLFFFVERPGIRLGRIVAAKAPLPEAAGRQ